MPVVEPAPAPPARPTGRAGRNLPAAIGVGVALAAAVVLTLGWFNWGFVALTAVMLALGAVEVHRALRRLSMHAAIAPIVVGTLAICLGSYYAAGHPELGVASNTLLLGLLALTVLAALVWRIPGGPDGFVKDAAASLFIIAYLPLLGSSVALMLAGDLGARRIITFLACVIANDTGGYIAGVLFGKHQLAPTISPKKTWEGLAGSVALGIATGTVLCTWLLHAPFWVGIILGVTMVVFGTAGDLVESMIKRDVGIKDMSGFLPGHGGIMDRLDSLLVAAPVAWLVLYLLVPGG